MSVGEAWRTGVALARFLVKAGNGVTVWNRTQRPGAVPGAAVADYFTASPDLSKAMTAETLEAARSAIFAVYGVLPGLYAVAAQGPLVREAQRHLAGWVLQPICELVAE